MIFGLIATGRWVWMGPWLASVSEPGAWLPLLQLDHSPLGAPSHKIGLERYGLSLRPEQETFPGFQSLPQGLRVPSSVLGYYSSYPRR